MTSIDPIASLLSEGTLDSSGTFTLDPDAMGRKAFRQLSVPWLVRLISSGISAGATRVEVDYRADRLVVWHDGSPPQLEHALSWQHASQPGQPALAEGLQGALQSGLGVELEIWAQGRGRSLCVRGRTVRLGPLARRALSRHPRDGTQILCRASIGPLMGLVMARDNQEIADDLRQRFALAPSRVTVLVNGVRANLPFDLKPSVVLCRLEHEELDLPAAGSDACVEMSVACPDMAGVVALVSSPKASGLTLVVEGQRCPCVALPLPGLPPVRALICCPALRLDLSRLNVVQDQALERVLEKVRQTAEQMTEALAGQWESRAGHRDGEMLDCLRARYQPLGQPHRYLGLMRARAPHCLATHLAVMGELEPAARHLEGLLSQEQDGQDQLDLLANLTCVRALQGRSAQARRDLDEALARLPLSQAPPRRRLTLRLAELWLRPGEFPLKEPAPKSARGNALEMAERAQNQALAAGLKQGDWKRSESHIRRSLQHLAPEHPEWALASSFLGWTLLCQGRHEEARASLQESLAARSCSFGADSLYALETAMLLAEAEHAQGRLEEALARRRWALERYRCHLSAASPAARGVKLRLTVGLGAWWIPGEQGDLLTFWRPPLELEPLAAWPPPGHPIEEEPPSDRVLPAARFDLPPPYDAVRLVNDALLAGAGRVLVKDDRRRCLITHDAPAGAAAEGLVEAARHRPGVSSLSWDGQLARRTTWKEGEAHEELLASNPMKEKWATTRVELLKTGASTSPSEAEALARILAYADRRAEIMVNGKRVNREVRLSPCLAWLQLESPQLGLELGAPRALFNRRVSSPGLFAAALALPAFYSSFQVTARRGLDLLERPAQQRRRSQLEQTGLVFRIQGEACFRDDPGHWLEGLVVAPQLQLSGLVHHDPHYRALMDSLMDELERLLEQISSGWPDLGLKNGCRQECDLLCHLDWSFRPQARLEPLLPLLSRCQGALRASGDPAIRAEQNRWTLTLATALSKQGRFREASELLRTRSPSRLGKYFFKRTPVASQNLALHRADALLRYGQADPAAALAMPLMHSHQLWLAGPATCLAVRAWQARGRSETALAIGQRRLQVGIGEFTVPLLLTLGSYAEALKKADDNWLAAPFDREPAGYDRAGRRRLASYAGRLACKCAAALGAGDSSQAESLGNEALACNRAVYGEPHPEVACNRCLLAIALGRLGAYERAAEQLQQARAAHLPESFPVAEIDLIGAWLARLGGNAEQGRALRAQAERILRPLLTPEHPVWGGLVDLTVSHHTWWLERLGSQDRESPPPLVLSLDWLRD